MILKKMRIRQFRNYEDQTLMFDQGIQYITGRNAQGENQSVGSYFIFVNNTFSSGE